MVPKNQTVAGECEEKEYVTFSDGGNYFVLMTERAQRSSEVYVKCKATGRDVTFTQLFHLYVQTDEQFPYPMDNVTAPRGTTAFFQCPVYFDVINQDKCGRSRRIRWNHKGSYAAAPIDWGGRGFDSGKYWVSEDRSAYKNIGVSSGSILRIFDVQKDDEGPVICQVRWGPGHYDFAEEEAYLTVSSVCS